MKTFDFHPDWTARPTPFRQTWGSICNIDQFRWLSRADVLEHLQMARDELGVRYVRAAAMYSPEMRVWEYQLRDWRTPAKDKTESANWQMIDLTLERLLALGLKPIYTTCFVPKGMSDDPTCCWPDRNSVGMPRDLALWQEFVASGIRHHVSRYGIEEVRSWLFECWNEPNLKGFFSGSKEDFFKLWSATWHAVKSVDPSLRFGGPSTARGEWITEFLDFAEKDGTMPDYLITHVYNNDSESEPLSPFDGPASYKVKDSPHFATGVVRGLRKELTERGWNGEIHWNEWGRSWFPHDPARESGLDAAFVVKTMSECSQDADAFAFWCLSDIYDQAGFQASEFEGHYGMLSLHGLRKPVWQAHQLLNRLGTSRLPVRGGDPVNGMMAALHKDRAVGLVYAYPEKLGESPTKVTLRVAWPSGQTPPRLIRLGAEENNIVATWRALGSPAYPTPQQICELRAANQLTESPADALRIEEGEEGPVAIFEVESPGVALIFSERRVD